MNQIGNTRLIFVGLGLSLVFWFLEALLHVLVFGPAELLQQLFWPQLHEVWMRLTVMAMFIAFGVYAQRMLEARRRAEESARLANAELNQIFETAADGMRVVDRNFNVVRANDTFAKLVGQPKSAIVGSRCFDVFRGDLCDTPGCPLNRVLKGEERVDYDAEKIRSDDSSVPCMVTATPFRRPDGELLGIVEDFKDITEYRRSEQELMESRKHLRELTRHLHLVRERERSRIAREIHDELGQTLTALKMGLHWIGKQLPPDNKTLADEINGMLRLVATTVNSVRRICSELRPSILDEFGLTAAIEWQAEEFTKRTDIPCTVNIKASEGVLEQDLSVAVFRIFQETLTNIMRHAQADQVWIDLSVASGKLDLCVCDNGRGMAAELQEQHQSFGLIGIRERVRDFGGELDIDTALDRGTRIKVRIPLSSEQQP
ncbi:MAG: histidine kinase [Candidatus Thiodiazotropha sp.]